MQIAVAPFGVALVAAEDVPPEEQSSEDPVLFWNEIAIEAVAQDHTGTYGTPEQMGPGGTTRSLGMVHGAIFDAVNSIERTHQPYRVLVPVEAHGASIDAAVAYAAHGVLSSLYLHQTAVFDAALSNRLALIADGDEKTLGIIVGRIVAETIIADRINDGADGDMSYTPLQGPGLHRKDPTNPNQPYLSPQWGNVTPFLMDDWHNYQIAPPPALTSQEYTDAYNQVKSLGGNGTTTPTDRTEEQTEIGIYWAYDGTKEIGTPPRMYNQIIKQIGVEKGNTVAENARLLALVNLAQADAGIASWGSKYVYNFWRPIIGIREADEGTGPTGLGDGNPDTAGDSEWTPLGAPGSNQTGNNFTPPFPAYPSGHATFGAASFHTVALFYGTDAIPFTFVSDELNGVTTDKDGNVRPLSPRSFDTMSEAILENATSRIYLGIHWIFDATGGMEMGTEIADYNFTHALQPSNELATCVVPGEEPEIPDENTVTCITTNDYDLTPSVTSPVSVERGSSFTNTLTVSNAGPGNAQGASISIDLPEGISLNAVNSGSCTQTGSTVICSDMNIDFESTVSAEVELSVSEEHACPSSVSFTPRVTSNDEGDYYGPNNIGDTVTIAIDCEPINDLSAILSGPSSVDEGTTIVLGLSIANAGPAGAATALGELPLIAGVSFAPSESSAGCTQEGNTIRCLSGGIAPEQSATFAIAFTPLATLPCGSDYIFQASVRSGEVELNPLDNTSSDVRVTVDCVDDGGNETETIDELRERIQDEEHASSNPGSGRGSGTHEATTTLALLCQRNGMEMAHGFTGSYKVRGNNPEVMSTLVASDTDVITDGFTESERAIICGMKKFINQEDMPKRRTPEFQDWLTVQIAEALHRTQEEIIDALASETLCK